MHNHNNSVFAVRTASDTNYFNEWYDAFSSKVFEVGCIDEIYLDGENPVYEYKAGNPNFSMGYVE